jgi:hypothetical protein
MTSHGNNNQSLDPAIADVVESFYAVELISARLRRERDVRLSLEQRFLLV